MVMNKRIVLASRPKGMPSMDNFRFEEAPLPEPIKGQASVRTLYISVDPYMRGRMNDTKSYVPPFPLNQVIAGGSIGQVVVSRDDSLKAGDIVLGQWGWQQYTVTDAEHLRAVNPKLGPITTALGVLGMPGLTAYFGLLDIGRPRDGETVVVSGAAGAVGMIVGQLAKISGCRAVGIAGSADKVAYLTDELGFDAAVNYKTADLAGQLAQACPQGVDIYFDNVGGEVSDAVLGLINKGARIPLCGQISLYNLERQDIGPRIQTQLLINSALMKGFIVGQYAPDFPEAIAELSRWVAEKKIKYSETIVEGFEKTPSAFLGLFSGENTGKQLVKVADPE